MKTLDQCKWKAFVISEIAYVGTGANIPKQQLTDGNIPRISATDANNGVESFTVKHSSIRNYRTYKNWYGKRNVGYLESKIVEDWSFSISNKDMVSNTDLNKILCYFNTNKSQGATIYNYLASNNVFNGSPTPNYRPSKIITKFSGSNKFAEGDSIEMFVESCHGWDNGEYYTQKSASNNDVATITSSNEDFVVRQKAVADTFDIDTGEIINSDIVGAVATYYKSNKHIDDMAMFWDTNYVERLYKNDSKINQLIHLRIVDAKTYYKESYIGSDTGRDYYKCNLDYKDAEGNTVYHYMFLYNLLLDHFLLFHYYYFSLYLLLFLFLMLFGLTL